MRVVSEVSLKDFDFWSGAKPLAEKLTSADFDLIEEIMEECEPEEGWSETAINDLFWFEGDLIAEWLGYDDEEALMEREEEEA